MIRSKIIRSVSSLVTGALLILLLFYDNESAKAVSAALSLAIEKVIPPLFPYMVLSSVIVSENLLSPISDHIPMDKWFGLPRCTASVMLMGWLCGYPVGAAGCVKLLEAGEITTDEASRLCALSSVCGPAFLLGTVSSMWGSKAYGVLLYIAQLICAVIPAVLFRKKFPSEKNVHVMSSPQKSSPFSIVFCTAVSDAAMTALVVCAYITFFRVLGTMLALFLPRLTFLFKAVLEFSGGCEFGASIGGKLGMICTGFAVGFGGCSIFMQICNIIGRSSIPFKRTFLTKTAGGIILSAISIVFYHMNPLSASSDVSVNLPYISHWEIIVSLALLVFLVFLGKHASRINYFNTKY